MSDIVLHGIRLSPFVEKTYRALRYKGLDFELAELGSPMELAKLSPVTRKMPVAVFGGERLHDSTFILRRAEEERPDPPFFSSDPEVAASQRRLEDWADESLYWMAMALRFGDRNRAASVAQLAGSVPAFLRPLAKPMIARQIGGMVRAQGFGRLPVGELERELGIGMDDLVASLAGRPFFWSDRPGAADFAVYGQLNFLKAGTTPEAEDMIADRPALADWAKRVEEASGGA